MCLSMMMLIQLFVWKFGGILDNIISGIMRTERTEQSQSKAKQRKEITKVLDRVRRPVRTDLQECSEQEKAEGGTKHTGLAQVQGICPFTCCCPTRGLG